MTTRMAGFTRGGAGSYGGTSLAFTVVGFTPGINPGAARAYAKEFTYGTTGGPYRNFYASIQKSLTGVDPNNPTPDTTVTMASAGATVDATTSVVTVLQDAVVTSVTYTPASTITGANSPTSRTVKLINTGTDNSGSLVVATLAFVSGVNATGSVAKTITLSSNKELCAVGAGDVLKWVSTHVGGTGKADPGGDVIVTFDEV